MFGRLFLLGPVSCMYVSDTPPSSCCAAVVPVSSRSKRRTIARSNSRTKLLDSTGNEEVSDGSIPGRV